MTASSTSTPLRQQIPLLVTATVVLAFVTILGYFGHVDPSTTLATITGLATAAGVTGVAVYLSATPNSALIAHLILFTFLVAAVTALTLHNVLTSGDVTVFIGTVLGVPIATAPAIATAKQTLTLTAPVESLTAKLARPIEPLAPQSSPPAGTSPPFPAGATVIPPLHG